MNKTYQVVIGLEVHAQLLTHTKLFCGDSTSFGAEPNTHISPIALAHPGTLPIINKAVIALAVKLGLALQCDIAEHHYFVRKNYFYPDLPKGYQVSQHTAPICQNGFLQIHTNEVVKKVVLNRIHIEEDAGKSIHDIFENETAIDLNRAGTPLLEIVTEPCLHSAEEAYNYLTELRKLVRWLNVCDGNMEEGSLRCDANISIRLHGDEKLGTRVEVKNLNSIRNVKKAIEVEVERLIAIIEKGDTIKQETRSFNADTNTTFALRSKEEADDYRYFPEPDLPAFTISKEYIENIKINMGALPWQLQEQFEKEFGLNNYDAVALCTDKADADLFKAITAIQPTYKPTANWIIGPIKNYCNEHQINVANFPLQINELAQLIHYTETGAVHFNIASTKLLQACIADTSKTAQELATTLGLLQTNNTDELLDWVNQTLAEMPDKVKEYQSGKKGLIGLFAGQVKKLSKGKADMATVNKLLTEALEK